MPATRLPLLLLLLLLAGGAPALAKEPPILLPGQETILDRCLRVAVLAINDRDGVLDHFDWVTLRVKNGCPTTRRHLLLEVMLVDPLGRQYGARIWVLQRGESLRPGLAKTDDFAIPDPDNHMPQKWSARMIYVEAARTAQAPAASPRRAAGR